MYLIQGEKPGLSFPTFEERVAALGSVMSLDTDEQYAVHDKLKRDLDTEDGEIGVIYTGDERELIVQALKLASSDERFVHSSLAGRMLESAEYTTDEQLSARRDNHTSSDTLLPPSEPSTVPRRRSVETRPYIDRLPSHFQLQRFVGSSLALHGLRELLAAKNAIIDHIDEQHRLVANADSSLNKAINSLELFRPDRETRTIHDVDAHIIRRALKAAAERGESYFDVEARVILFNMTQDRHAMRKHQIHKQPPHNPLPKHNI
jgi:hypothetical protein